MITKTLVTGAVVTMVATPVAAEADTRPNPQALLDRIVASGTVSAIAEIRDGDKLWRGTSGKVSLGSSRPAPMNGRYRIGSPTKTFTATVLLQLVEEGKLQLTDTVEQWLPGLLTKEDVTVKNLLQHTSGIPDYTKNMFDEYGPKDRYRTWTPKELVARVAKLPPEFAPGARFSYSNTNYIVLGMLIERVTGRPYETEVRERIVRPLGLRHTSLPGASPQIPGPHAHNYLPTKSGMLDVTRFNPTIAYAAGEIISTTQDMNQFYRALFQGKLLPQAQVKQMQESGKQYGYGLEVAPLPCGTMYGHGGGGPGFRTVSFSTPDASRQLALSIAMRDGDAQEATMKLLTSALCP
ncbi:serine hydrolase domain-containing protein [Nonomuraea sp. NPDC050536]|uniref:serine hydrolase domain-containing protein n=1 Tax=Nonomuraea sp. NPDC050536 TaxID=3364366 RepID=UPI0037C778BC